MYDSPLTSYQVHLINKEHKIDQVIICPSDKFILDVVEEDYKMTLPYSCRAGACSACAAKVVGEGSVDQEEQTYLDADQLASGFVLLCCSKPTSDLTLQTHEEENIF